MTSKECALHPRSMLDSMNALKDEELFCDIAVKAGQDEIKAHKFVLMAASVYFQAMFSSDTKESKTGIVKQCINFIYSGKVDFSLDRITDFIKASDIFCLHNLTNLYVEFLSENIAIGNVDEMLSVARVYQKEVLKSSIQIFFRDNLQAFIESQEMRSLPQDEFLHALPLMENWGKEYEMLKWDAVVTWVKHDMDGRKDAFDDCFQSIDLSFLPQQFISENFFCEDLVINSKECLLKLSRQAYMVEKRPKSMTVPTEPITGIVSCNKESGVVYRYSLLEEKWSLFSKLPIITKWLDVVEYRGLMYVTTGNAIYSFLGMAWKKLYGSESDEEYNRCIGCGKYFVMVTAKCAVIHEIGADKSSSIQIKKKDKPFDSFSITSAEECIYVIGVRNGYYNTAAYKINLKTMQSAEIARVPVETRKEAVFEYKGFVYVISHTSDDVVFYNDITKQWQFIPDHKIKYISGCKVQIADKLYMYGGELGTKIKILDTRNLVVSENDRQHPSAKNVDMDVCVSCLTFSK